MLLALLVFEKAVLRLRGEEERAVAAVNYHTLKWRRIN